MSDEENEKNKNLIEEFKLKSILASGNINFLFGSGINGSAFPQLNKFDKTNTFLRENYNGDSLIFEEQLNSLGNANKEIAIKLFVDEFNYFMDKLEYSHKDIIEIKDLFEVIYELIDKKEDRQIESSKVNIFTLNYDDIIETILSNNSYFNTTITVDRFKRTSAFDTVCYNYVYHKNIPTFITSKLHGTVEKGKLDSSSIIYPGNDKYKIALGSKYFELMFLMKSQLIKKHSILIIIGYSGNDYHLNEIISDGIESGLCVIWIVLKVMKMIFYYLLI